MMNRKMLKQAQDLQKRMAQMQDDMENKTVETTSGGGVIKVVVSGKMHVESITIDPEAVDPEDVEMLEDLVLTAINEGLTKAQEMVSKEMSSLTGGFKIPGLS